MLESAQDIRRARTSNAQAAQSVASILSSTLGPNSRLKMLIDSMGGIVLTNDGYVILREIDVSHPAAKSVVEVSRAQDEESGDGTSTAVILLGEVLALSMPLLEQGMHPSIIQSVHMKSLTAALQAYEAVSTDVDLNSPEAVLNVLRSSLSGKTAGMGLENLSQIAMKALETISHGQEKPPSQTEVRKFVRIEKIPGGNLEDCQILSGIAVEKECTHPKMRRRIENPRVVMIDSPLEYKKGESVTKVEISSEAQWEALLMEEEEEIKRMCECISSVGCDLVVTQKGVSDLAQHFLVKAGVSVVRRVKKTEADRIARVTGATICNRVDELVASDVGHKSELFFIDKIGDDFYSYFMNSKDPRACTILLRGGSKDTLNEMERCLVDALSACRNLRSCPKMLPGGGAAEMMVSRRLQEMAAKESDVFMKRSLEVFSQVLQVIPRTLAANTGGSVVKMITELRDKHLLDGCTTWGITQNAGVADTASLHVYDSLSVKQSALRISVETACSLLRIDEIVAGRAVKKDEKPINPSPEETPM